ncbi:hypothetical protein KIPB_001611 [Kipferlia bialata]|uniref:Uncharacterized protein n=1 Tax=Kipferlia bialata TaxID=797122 RepID=A0A391NIU8_9EUKA|nr:hypothetical protein KIPB_001611 [Kipferlia bialata]|eukprot:g1611.t1
MQQGMLSSAVSLLYTLGQNPKLHKTLQEVRVVSPEGTNSGVVAIMLRAVIRQSESLSPDSELSVARSQAWVRLRQTSGEGGGGEAPVAVSESETDEQSCEGEDRVAGGALPPLPPSGTHPTHPMHGSEAWGGGLHREASTTTAIAVQHLRELSFCVPPAVQSAEPLTARERESDRVGEHTLGMALSVIAALTLSYPENGAALVPLLCASGPGSMSSHTREVVTVTLGKQWGLRIGDKKGYQSFVKGCLFKGTSLDEPSPWFCARLGLLLGLIKGMPDKVALAEYGLLDWVLSTVEARPDSEVISLCKSILNEACVHHEEVGILYVRRGMLQRVCQRLRKARDMHPGALQFLLGAMCRVLSGLTELDVTGASERKGIAKAFDVISSWYDPKDETPFSWSRTVSGIRHSTMALAELVDIGRGEEEFVSLLLLVVRASAFYPCQGSAPSSADVRMGSAGGDRDVTPVTRHSLFVLLLSTFKHHFSLLGRDAQLSVCSSLLAAPCMGPFLAGVEYSIRLGRTDSHSDTVDFVLGFCGMLCNAASSDSPISLGVDTQIVAVTEACLLELSADPTFEAQTGSAQFVTSFKHLVSLRQRVGTSMVFGTCVVPLLVSVMGSDIDPSDIHQAVAATTFSRQLGMVHDSLSVLGLVVKAPSITRAVSHISDTLGEEVPRQYLAGALHSLSAAARSGVSELRDGDAVEGMEREDVVALVGPLIRAVQLLRTETPSPDPDPTLDAVSVLAAFQPFFVTHPLLHVYLDCVGANTGLLDVFLETGTPFRDVLTHAEPSLGRLLLDYVGDGPSAVELPVRMHMVRRVISTLFPTPLIVEGPLEDMHFEHVRYAMQTLSRDCLADTAEGGARPCTQAQRALAQEVVCAELGDYLRVNPPEMKLPLAPLALALQAEVRRDPFSPSSTSLSGILSQIVFRSAISGRPRLSDKVGVRFIPRILLHGLAEYGTDIVDVLFDDAVYDGGVFECMELDIGGCLAQPPILAVPKAATRLFPNLSVMDLSDNDIHVFGDLLRHTPSLAVARLGGNPLTALPETLFELERLAELNLDRTSLSVLPRGINMLHSLRELSVCDTPVVTCLFDIRLCPRLSLLDLSGTCVSGLPDSFSEATDLATRTSMMNEGGGLFERHLPQDSRTTAVSLMSVGAHTPRTMDQAPDTNFSLLDSLQALTLRLPTDYSSEPDHSRQRAVNVYVCGSENSGRTDVCHALLSHLVGPSFIPEDTCGPYCPGSLHRWLSVQVPVRPAGSTGGEDLSVILNIIELPDRDSSRLLYGSGVFVLCFSPEEGPGSLSTSVSMLQGRESKGYGVRAIVLEYGVAPNSPPGPALQDILDTITGDLLVTPDEALRCQAPMSRMSAELLYLLVCESVVSVPMLYARSYPASAVRLLSVLQEVRGSLWMDLSETRRLAAVTSHRDMPDVNEAVASDLKILEGLGHVQIHPREGLVILDPEVFGIVLNALHDHSGSRGTGQMAPVLDIDGMAAVLCEARHHQQLTEAAGDLYGIAQEEAAANAQAPPPDAPTTLSVTVLDGMTVPPSSRAAHGVAGCVPIPSVYTKRSHVRSREPSVDVQGATGEEEVQEICRVRRFCSLLTRLGLIGPWVYPKTSLSGGVDGGQAGNAYLLPGALPVSSPLSLSVLRRVRDVATGAEQAVTALWVVCCSTSSIGHKSAPYLEVMRPSDVVSSSSPIPPAAVAALLCAVPYVSECIPSINSLWVSGGVLTVSPTCECVVTTSSVYLDATDSGKGLKCAFLYHGASRDYAMEGRVVDCLSHALRSILYRFSNLQVHSILLPCPACGIPCGRVSPLILADTVYGSESLAAECGLIHPPESDAPEPLCPQCGESVLFEFHTDTDKDSDITRAHTGLSRLSGTLSSPGPSSIHQPPCVSERLLADRILKDIPVILVPTCVQESFDNVVGIGAHQRAGSNRQRERESVLNGISFAAFDYVCTGCTHPHVAARHSFIPKDGIPCTLLEFVQALALFCGVLAEEEDEDDEFVLPALLAQYAALVPGISGSSCSGGIVLVALEDSVTVAGPSTIPSHVQDLVDHLNGVYRMSFSSCVMGRGSGLLCNKSAWSLGYSVSTQWEEERTHLDTDRTPAPPVARPARASTPTGPDTHDDETPSLDHPHPLVPVAPEDMSSVLPYLLNWLTFAECAKVEAVRRVVAVGARDRLDAFSTGAGVGSRPIRKALACVSVCRPAYTGSPLVPTSCGLTYRQLQTESGVYLLSRNCLDAALYTAPNGDTSVDVVLCMADTRRYVSPPSLGHLSEAPPLDAASLCDWQFPSGAEQAVPARYVVGAPCRLSPELVVTLRVGGVDPSNRPQLVCNTLGAVASPQRSRILALLSSNDTARCLDNRLRRHSASGSSPLAALPSVHRRIPGLSGINTPAFSSGMSLAVVRPVLADVHPSSAKPPLVSAPQTRSQRHARTGGMAKLSSVPHPPAALTPLTSTTSSPTLHRRSRSVVYGESTTHRERERARQKDMIREFLVSGFPCRVAVVRGIIAPGSIRLHPYSTLTSLTVARRIGYSFLVEVSSGATILPFKVTSCRVVPRQPSRVSVSGVPVWGDGEVETVVECQIQLKMDSARAAATLCHIATELTPDTSRVSGRGGASLRRRAYK